MPRTNIRLLLYNPETSKVAVALAVVLLVWLTMPHPALAEGTAQAGGGDLIDKLAGLTKSAVMFIIGLSGLVLTISVALGGFSAQYASLMGVPYAQASAGMKVATAVLLFSLTAGTMVIANLVVDTVGGLISTDASIHVIR